MSHWESGGESDEWYTPKYVMESFECSFDLDVAAPKLGPRHVKCSRWLSIEDDALTHEWNGFVWMNPPFGKRNGLRPWLKRFFDHGNGIALTPDRTSAPWWQEASRETDVFLFTTGKVAFERPDGTVAKSPSTGVTLWAVGERGVNALVNAEKNGLGVLAELKGRK